MASKRVALYARVSTDGQTVENQLRELRAVAKRHNWKVDKVFKDNGVSGAKGRKQRPGYDALCEGITRRDFDMVAAWSVDRLGRSLRHLVTFLEELNAKGVDLYLHQQGLDTSTPAGRAMFQMCGVFGEFERAMTQERIKAGLARTTKRIGRPPVAEETVAAVLAAHGDGKSIRAIARERGVPKSTVHKIVADHH